MNELEKLQQDVKDTRAVYANTQKALDRAYDALDVAIGPNIAADTAFELATNALTEYLKG
jgi:hypothetical protein|tara:strand:+ start:230 stop:409 length:180 start_codon:yes stop_codon:yes gene_type:complete